MPQVTQLEGGAGISHRPTSAAPCTHKSSVNVYCGFPVPEGHSEAGQHFWNALLFSRTVSLEVVVLFLGVRQIVDSGLVGTAFWL